MQQYYLLFLLPIQLSANDDLIHAENLPSYYSYKSWFTGSLLAPTPVNMKVGHPLIQPILLAYQTYGKYNSRWQLENAPTVWTINP